MSDSWIFPASDPYAQLAKQAAQAREWKDWVWSPPSLMGYDEVEACRFDSIWPEPKVIKVGADPALNVSGLKWRAKP